MKSFFAFIKKEINERVRTGRMLLLVIVFVLIGIMNPAVAKLTPFLLSSMSESLAQSGIEVGNVVVTDMDSWLQFFKNAPMALIAFVLVECGIFAKEYQSGTLIPILTKGLQRYKVVLAKWSVSVMLWSLCYFLSYVITLVYTEYYWSDGIAQNIMFAVTLWWLFGVAVVSLLVSFSVVFTSSGGALFGVCGVACAAYIVGLFPKTQKYTPAMLMQSTKLLYGTAEKADHTAAVIITAAIIAVSVYASIIAFNKKDL